MAPLKFDEYDQRYVVGSTASLEWFSADFSTISALFSVFIFLFLMCSERQSQSDKIDRLAFERCNWQLHDVDKVEQGNHNSAIRFEDIVISPRFFCTKTLT